MPPDGELATLGLVTSSNTNETENATATATANAKDNGDGNVSVKLAAVGGKLKLFTQRDING